jgi:hypothetical protein
MSKKPTFEIEAKVAGRFVLEKFKGGEDGKPIGDCIQRLEFDNLITDAGLAKIWSSNRDGFGVSYLFSGCVVGSGNTAPAVTDTQLENLVATRSNGQYQPTVTYVAGPPSYWRAVCNYQFSTGAAAGNLTEVGIFSYNDQTKLISRALIVDVDGNPTNIVVEADEVLNVTYEFRSYINTSDIAGTFESDGVVYDTVLRGADVDNSPGVRSSIADIVATVVVYSGTIGSITQLPSGTSATFANVNGGGSYSNFALLGGVASVDFSTTGGVNAGNFGAGGIRAMYFSTDQHKFQMSFNDPLTGNGIPKVSGEQMIVTVRFKWSRYAS